MYECPPGSCSPAEPWIPFRQSPLCDVTCCRSDSRNPQSAKDRKRILLAEEDPRCSHDLALDWDLLHCWGLPSRSAAAATPRRGTATCPRSTTPRRPAALFLPRSSPQVLKLAVNRALCRRDQAPTFGRIPDFTSNRPGTEAICDTASSFSPSGGYANCITLCQG